jgi:hypothetical protein
MTMVNVPFAITNQPWLIKNIMKYHLNFYIKQDRTQHKNKFTNVLNDIKALRIIRKDFVYGKMRINVIRNLSVYGMTPANYYLEDITTLTPQSIIFSDEEVYNHYLSSKDKNLVEKIFKPQLLHKWKGLPIYYDNINTLLIKEDSYLFDEDELLNHTPEDVEKYL